MSQFWFCYILGQLNNDQILISNSNKNAIFVPHYDQLLLFEERSLEYTNTSHFDLLDIEGNMLQEKGKIKSALL